MSKPNRKVIRLQQMRAQIAQAAGVQHVDIVFEVPGDTEGTVREKVCSFLTQDFWPAEVVRIVEEEGNSSQLDVLRKVASPPEAFDELVSVAQLTIGELKEIIEELGKEAGTEQGEGSGSSSSSVSTPGASELISSATTQAVA